MLQKYPIAHCPHTQKLCAAHIKTVKKDKKHKNLCFTTVFATHKICVFQSKVADLPKKFTMNAYERFGKYIMSVTCPESLDFYKICKAIHVSPTSMNEILEEELGFNGEDFVDAYRKCVL